MADGRATLSEAEAGASTENKPVATVEGGRQRGVRWQAWLRSSLKGNSKHMPYAKYVQLATVTVEGRPANRTVVFRGFLGDGTAQPTPCLTFVTDARSGKVAEVANNPYAEVAWYFPESREQYRISGTLTIVGEGHEDAALLDARKAAWEKMGEKGREQFAWPLPGAMRNDSAAPCAFDVAGELVAPGTPPLSDFCLVVLHVSAVDHLNLRKNRRHKWTLARGDRDPADAASWDEAELNP